MGRELGRGLVRWLSRKGRIKKKTGKRDGGKKRIWKEWERTRIR